MIPGTQPKIELNLDTQEPKYTLVRERDNLTKESADVLWIEWDEEGRYKQQHSTPSIGRSLLMSPFNQFYTWLCTPITEILEQHDNIVRFKTENSEYTLHNNNGK